ncbi:MAG: hypothetical protein WA096_11890 [Smithella sp.]|jgi:hypothetical protein
MWTILSGIFGGVLRLAPELLKFLDAKNDRKHELDMQDKALEFQKLKGDQRLDEIGAQGAADWNTGAINALKTAIEGQDRPSGIRWIDGFSKLMRPLITFQWVVLLYPGVIVATFVLLIINGVPVVDALNKVFGPEEKALVSFIVDFWFVGRVLEGGRRLANK